MDYGSLSGLHSQPILVIPFGVLYLVVPGGSFIHIDLPHSISYLSGPYENPTRGRRASHFSLLDVTGTGAHPFTSDNRTNYLFKT